MSKAYQCENCKRITNQNLTKLENDSHIAFLCSTCHHVLSMEVQQERFKQMVRNKNFEQSNEEMQKVHKMLTGLIGTGIVLSAIAFSVLIPSVSEYFPSIGALTLNLFK